ncbi:MAG: hypothetical protein K0U98_07780 [Deltaproteobacteria bacterium]|nr:hypothetical protein [Deltaproteobacteria bacterium]
MNEKRRPRGLTEFIGLGICLWMVCNESNVQAQITADPTLIRRTEIFSDTSPAIPVKRSTWAPTVLPAHEKVSPAQEEPIAYIGHGAFFDHSGEQIVPTAEFVDKAQSWYRARLLTRLTPDQHAEFARFERRLTAGISLDEQTNLIAHQRSLDWLLANSTLTAEDGRMLGKLRALKSRLNWVLPRRDDLEELRNLKPFQVDLMLESRLRQPDFNPTPQTDHLVTTNSGQPYLDECALWRVPIPKPIGISILKFSTRRPGRAPWAPS